MRLLKLQKLCLVLKVLAFSCFLVLQETSAVSGISPSSSVDRALPPRGEEIVGDVSPPQTNGTILNPPIAPLPAISAPGPGMSRGFTPTSQPHDPTSTPPYTSDHPPGALSGNIPVSSPSNNPYQKPQHPEHPIFIPEAPVPVGLPSYQSPPRPPASRPPIPLPKPPIPVGLPSYQSPPRPLASRPPITLPEPPSAYLNNTPPHVPSSPAAKEQPPRIIPVSSPPVHPVEPVVMPPSPPDPVAPAPSKLQDTFSPPQPTLPTEPPSNSSVPNPGRVGKPVAAPPNGTDHHLHVNPLSPTHTPSRGINPGRVGKPLAVPLKGISNLHPSISPLPSNVTSSHQGKGNILSTPPPPPPPPVLNASWNPMSQPPESVPSTTAQIPPIPRDKTTAPVSQVKDVPYHVSPKHEPEHPRTNIGLHASPPRKSEDVDSPGPPAVSVSPPHRTKGPTKSPEVNHSQPTTKFPKMPVQALPPPPPNEDCATLICSEPFTNGPSGSPCRCVFPIQVGLRLGVALYTFFPLVSELATEISAGNFLEKSQVRIMGANEASQDPEKTIVLANLVPLGEKFDNITANLIFLRFWHKQLDIKTSLFGNYEVLYVRYPGLPPSPPSATSDIDVIDNDPYHNHSTSSGTTKPIGVDVSRIRHNTGPNKGVIAIIVLSASVAVLVVCAVLWVFLFKEKGTLCHPQKNPPAPVSSFAKSSGPSATVAVSGPGSASMSLGSSIAAYTGSIRTFRTSEIERATDNFNEMTVLGEGGFGRVYRGVLDDGTQVAVKVLKRDDHQGGLEFLAEVEMLSRLHHRNLVKLIGICTEEHSRCLVYELVPNGSVESHLHDEGTAPLDWTARLKIALGAARGLAYLHEDSSPRVIHRDFKASNILLEQDYTPKVSDFGLARAALDEDNRHISTRVMGTFGYVAPEYAMTGHLLVKSDVYSYGVVLLELLTGKKPVDMSQPPGQENLVSWARPFLTSKEGLESIVDKSLGPDFPFDSIAKVAAIASMCVQPEVSNRPFMGEVVQALKLVCNECEETRELGSRSFSREDISIDMEARISSNYSECELDPHCSTSYNFRHDAERGISVSELMSSSGRSERIEHESLRRHSSSGPLRSINTRWPWQNMRRLSGGSISEHHMMYKLWPRNR